MKILQVINSLSTGGAEKLLIETLPLYNKAGIEMDILLLWDNDCLFTQKLRELKCCNIFILKKSQNNKDIYSINHIFKIRKLIKKYDIIHVHLFPAQYFVAIANIAVGKKLIFTEHNTSNKRIRNSNYNFIQKWIYSKYEKIICISVEIKNIYQKYLNDFSDKFIVINNGVDLNKIQNAISFPKKNINSKFTIESKLIIQVSGFRPQKDQMTVIRSLELLPKNYFLLLVGDGERRYEHEKYVKELNLEDRVFFLGQRMDIPELLKSSDCVVLSSHYEGLSLASVEGMASGKPFIASDVPGLTEIVKGAGILFEKSNSKQLAIDIENVVTDKNYCNQVVKLCQERSQNFTIVKMVEKHIDLYKLVFKDN